NPPPEIARCVISVRTEAVSAERFGKSAPRGAGRAELRELGLVEIDERGDEPALGARGDPRGVEDLELDPRSGGESVLRDAEELARRRDAGARRFEAALRVDERGLRLRDLELHVRAEAADHVVLGRHFLACELDRRDVEEPSGSEVPADEHESILRE